MRVIGTGTFGKVYLGELEDSDEKFDEESNDGSDEESDKQSMKLNELECNERIQECRHKLY